MTVDDRVALLARSENGAMGTFEVPFENGYRCHAVIDAVEGREPRMDPARNIGTEGGLGGEI